MFSFGKRKRDIDVRRLVRRMRDLSIPNYSSSAATDRRHERHNRSIPVLIAPWENEGPTDNESFFAIVRDLGDSGVGLVMSQPLRTEDIIIGFWPDEDDSTQPWFFRGKTKRCTPIGGGFWTIGIELTEYANAEYADVLHDLRERAKSLRPAFETPVLV